jgi:CarD family transcriptional regulator
MKSSAGTASKHTGGGAARRAPAARPAASPAKAAQGTTARKVAAPAPKAAPAKSAETKAAVKVAARPASAKPAAAAKAAAPAAQAKVETKLAVAPHVEPKPVPTKAPLVAAAENKAPAPQQPEPAAPSPVAQPAADRRPPMPDRIPPRPPAKAEIFVEGDHVVYPTHGVGKVERIAIEEIAGHKLELIHITFEENRMTLRVPVAKARSAGLRKLATRKLFDEALSVLKGRARIKRTMWSRRAQEYEAKINSGDPLAIAEVVRDLHRNAGQPDQSFSERQIYEAAMDRLSAELAALDKTDKMTAASKLTNFLKTV